LVRLSVKVIGEALACPTTKTKAREHSHTFARRPVLEDKALSFGFVAFIETPACIAYVPDPVQKKEKRKPERNVFTVALTKHR